MPSDNLFGTIKYLNNEIMTSEFKNICVLIGILFYSCSSESKKIHIETAPIEIEIKPQEDTLKLSSIFHDYEKIELKNKFLTDIIDVKLVDTMIIVLSRSEDSDLHVFNNKGNYIRSLARYGKGRDEVLNIQSICYNNFLNTIDAVCNYGMNIYQYPVDGYQPNIIKLPENTIFSSNDIEIIDKDIYILYKAFGNTNCQEYKLYIYNYTTNTIIDQYIPLDKITEEKISIGQKNNLFKMNNKIYFYETFQNGIYEYNEDTIKASIAFIKNQFSFPISDIDECNNESDLIRKCINSRYLWAHINCIEYNNNIFSFFTYLENVYLNVIYLDSNYAKTFYYIKDDIVTNTIFRSNLLNIISSDNGKLICNLWNNQLGTDVTYLLLFND